MYGVCIPLSCPTVQNAIQIQVMKGVYSILAVWMTNFENHASGTAYVP